MAIFSRNEEELFKFGSINELHEFQTALMGYEVSHDQGDVPVRCQLKIRNTSTLFDCRGRVQLWQEPIGQMPPQEDSEPSRSPSLRAPTSLSHRANSRHDSLTSSLPPPSTITSNANGWEADTIKLPSINIFTQLEDSKGKTRFAAVLIQLQPGMKVDPKACSCARDGYNKCANLVIVREKQMFPAHVLQSETDAQGRPNPNTFDIFPLRLPRHPDFQRATITHQTEYLLLNFKSLSEKQRFHKELDLRFGVRDKQIENQRSFERWIINAQDRPQRGPRNLSSSPGQLSSSFDRSSGLFSAQNVNRNGSSSARASAVPVSPRQSATEDMIAPVAPPRSNSNALGRQQSMNTVQTIGWESRTNSNATTNRRDTYMSEASSSGGVHREIQAPKTSRSSSQKQPWWKKL